MTEEEVQSLDSTDQESTIHEHVAFVQETAPSTPFFGCWCQAKPKWMDGVVLLPLKMEVRLIIFSPLD